jgi:hypothetical protein
MPRSAHRRVIARPNACAVGIAKPLVSPTRTREEEQQAPGRADRGEGVDAEVTADDDGVRELIQLLDVADQQRHRDARMTRQGLPVVRVRDMRALGGSRGGAGLGVGLRRVRASVRAGLRPAGTTNGAPTGRLGFHCIESIRAPQTIHAMNARYCERMSVGLLAVVDDILSAALKASAKSAGVVIDDAAVTPQYVQG